MAQVAWKHYLDELNQAEAALEEIEQEAASYEEAGQPVPEEILTELIALGWTIARLNADIAELRASASNPRRARGARRASRLD